MFSNADSVQLIFNASTFFLFMGVVIISVFSYYIYRITIPQISRRVKTFLVILRSVILTLLLLLIFEPVLKISSSTDLEPVTAIFIDNTNSIVLSDSTESAEKINSIISILSKNLNC